MTRQRKVILEKLRNTNSHPTAGEVYDMVREELPRISLGTVYRNLDSLSRYGNAIKLDLDEEQKRFDGRIDPHYHLICLKCGQVMDIDLPFQNTIEEAASRITNCLVTGHKLAFTGLCPSCRKNNGGKKDG